MLKLIQNSNLFCEFLIYILYFYSDFFNSSVDHVKKNNTYMSIILWFDCMQDCTYLG